MGNRKWNEKNGNDMCSVFAKLDIFLFLSMSNPQQLEYLDDPNAILTRILYTQDKLHIIIENHYRTNYHTIISSNIILSSIIQKYQKR